MSPKALTLLAIAVVAAPVLAYPLPPTHLANKVHPSSPVPQELEQEQQPQSGALSWFKKFIPHIPGSFGKRAFEEDDIFARSFESDGELFAREPEPEPRIPISAFRGYTAGGIRSPRVYRREFEFEDLTARDDIEELVARDDFEDLTARDDFEELVSREDMEDIFARSMDSESELFAREPEPEPFGHGHEPFHHRFAFAKAGLSRPQTVEAREYEELLEREEVSDLFERSFDDAEELFAREDVDDMLMARAFDFSGDLEERSFDDLD